MYPTLYDYIQKLLKQCPVDTALLIDVTLDHNVMVNPDGANHISFEIYKCIKDFNEKQLEKLPKSGDV